MWEFVYGTDDKYDKLRETLNDHLCHVYKNCRFPDCCSRNNGRLGFEKEGETYALFIDKGITCNKRNAPGLFKEWISSGTLRFLDFTDMKEFLKSLRCLY